ncbi:MAG: response regulator transcription factor [Candidatus Omnitrophota bacterium]
MKKALIVEDEKNVVRVIRDTLEDDGFMVFAASTGEAGLEIALKENVDIVILDVMLPGRDGFEVCRGIKKKKITLPVIMLTARDSVEDKIKGLEFGADDYMTKPFSVKELSARIMACLRRVEAHRLAKEGSRDVCEIGGVTLDFRRMEGVKNGKKISFTKREIELLRYFLNRRGEVISRNDILDVIWGFETTPLTRTVDTFISRLRKKIEDKPSRPRHILSVRDAGYKLAE